jgi:hypothetical protein
VHEIRSFSSICEGFDALLKLQLRNWEKQAASISRRIERKENRTYVVKKGDLSGVGILYRVLGSGVDSCGASQCLDVQPVVEPLHPLPYSF